MSRKTTNTIQLLFDILLRIIIGHNLNVIGANSLGHNLHLCYSNVFLHLWWTQSRNTFQLGVILAGCLSGVLGIVGGNPSFAFNQYWFGKLANIHCSVLMTGCFGVKVRTIFQQLLKYFLLFAPRLELSFSMSMHCLWIWVKVGGVDKGWMIPWFLSLLPHSTILTIFNGTC